MSPALIAALLALVDVTTKMVENIHQRTVDGELPPEYIEAQTNYRKELVAEAKRQGSRSTTNP